jgi:hypothetical protein
MQRVYTAQSELEAHEASLFLESHGIRALVDGESAAFTNLSFTLGSEPGTLVDDVEVERAMLSKRIPSNRRSTLCERRFCTAMPRARQPDYVNQP